MIASGPNPHSVSDFMYCKIIILKEEVTTERSLLPLDRNHWQTHLPDSGYQVTKFCKRCSGEGFLRTQMQRLAWLAR